MTEAYYCSYYYQQRLAGQELVLDWQRPAVLSEELAVWQNGLSEFDLEYGEIDVSRRPFNQITRDFLAGEADCFVHQESGNSVNNPRRLIRPTSLHQIGDFTEGEYVDLVESFERLNFVILDSLNETDRGRRRVIVRQRLRDTFTQPTTRTERNIAEIDQSASEPGWLAYVVINIITSPSLGITPLARIFANDLLGLYSPDKLTTAFRGKDNHSLRFFLNGYDRTHIPRLPSTFYPEGIDEFRHWDWLRDDKIKTLFYPRERIFVEYKGDNKQIIGSYPNEAVSLALLFLHDALTTRAGFDLLSLIAQVDDREVLAKIFGPQATFYLELEMEGDYAKGDVANQGLQSDVELVNFLREQEGKERHDHERLRRGGDLGQKLWYSFPLLSVEKSAVGEGVSKGQKGSRLSGLPDGRYVYGDTVYEISGKTVRRMSIGDYLTYTGGDPDSFPELEFDPKDE